MLLNCNVGEDSWESLGLQGDPTRKIREISPEYSLEGLMLKLKLQYFGLPDVKNRLIGKDPDAGKVWRWEEKGTTEDEMVRWHHQLDGHDFEQAPGAGDGQGSLACCSSGLAKSQTWLSHWTEVIVYEHQHGFLTLHNRKCALMGSKHARKEHHPLFCKKQD